jgi:hypothetical protein
MPKDARMRWFAAGVALLVLILTIAHLASGGSGNDKTTDTSDLTSAVKQIYQDNTPIGCEGLPWQLPAAIARVLGRVGAPPGENPPTVAENGDMERQEYPVPDNHDLPAYGPMRLTGGDVQVYTVAGKGDPNNLGQATQVMASKICTRGHQADGTVDMVAGLAWHLGNLSLNQIGDPTCSLIAKFYKSYGGTGQVCPA